jgi:hypothetical protein
VLAFSPIFPPLLVNSGETMILIEFIKLQFLFHHHGLSASTAGKEKISK